MRTFIRRLGPASQHGPAWLAFIVALMLCLLVPAAVAAPRIADFMPKLKASEVFPGADRLGPVEGKPPVAKAFKGNELLGYVYITSDVVNTRGYSSFPIDTLIGLSTDGAIVSAKLMEHHEPIVLIGIPQSRVEHFINGYLGQNYVKNPPKPGAQPPVDIISGATVTMMVIGDSITRSAQAVGRAQGIGRPAGATTAAATPQVEKRVIDMDQTGTASWSSLLDSGAISRLHITIGALNKTFAESGRAGAAEHPQSGDPDDTFIDMYAALVSVPSIGRSLLGDAEYDYLKQRLQPGQQAILVAGNGIYSFKGSGYVRGGIFDRIEVVQDVNSFHFTDLDHQRLADVMAEGAPQFKEVALFTVPAKATFDPTQPWRLQLMVQRVINVQEKAFVTYNLNYDLPQAYTKPVASPPQTASAAGTSAGQPQPAASAAEEEHEIDQAPALYKQIWAAKKIQIAIVVAALLILGCVFFFQDRLTRHEVFYKRFRTGFLLFTLFWLGWYASAQLSVVNVLTFTHALRTDFRWEYFLMDPVVFILWVATAISLVFWNRGAFCGWLCPFGAMQELTNKVARKLRIPQIKLSYSTNNRLAAIKYIVFIFLFGFSLYEMALAEKLAEVEPFKTAIILKFIRDWPFVIFAVLLLLAGLFIERFYCRYLCALGAALAIPARLRIFDWLRRYPMCGNPCQRCATDCPVQAIEPEGPINPNECIQCLNCQMLYHHEQKCPHLIQKNARLQRRKAPPTEAAAAPAPAANPAMLKETTVRRPTVRPRTPDDPVSNPTTP
ncbi:4Fe-4S binding protein [Paracandidimonas lactea]|uniref:4Fe-4S binding protein n=1 Tax=Paracandidimonas lactea TaxID=2895524 RepID=UPI003F714217